MFIKDITLFAIKTHYMDVQVQKEVTSIEISTRDLMSVFPSY